MRREGVVLELDDRFSAPTLRAAASARVLRDSLDDTRRSSDQVPRSLSRVERAIDDTGATSRSSGPEIDRLSGRLRLLTDVAVTIGPAFVPMAALAIPAVTGLSAALGFAVTGVGVLVGSLQGVKDAIDLVAKADLEPTAENLQAAREALAGLSPEAAAFVVHLRDIVPELKAIRDAGAAGMFPGLDAGIDSLERRLPLVERLFSKVGTSIGDLAAEGGDSLASGRWGPFLRFMEDEAPDAITQLGHMAGDLTHGLAELWMAFDPLNDDVLGSLEKGADVFDRWASGLDQTAGFQDFMGYIEDTGPQVGETLGAVSNALLQIVEATAPLGGPVLHILEGVADALGAVADSDIGTPLFIGIAAMSALSRATAAWAAVSRSSVGQFIAGQRTVQSSVTGTTTRLAALGRSVDARSLARGGALIAGLAIAGSGAADGIGLTNTASLALMGTLGGPWGTAIGAAVGATMDLAAANDDLQDSLKRAKAAADSGTNTERAARKKELEGELADLQANYDGLFSGKDRNVGNFFGIGRDFGALVSAADGDIQKTKDQIADLDTAMGGARHAADLFAPGIGLAADELLRAANGAEDFTGALAQMNGFLDRRAALRSYNDDLATLTKGLKNGFSRKDVENIDATAKGILNVADGIKSAKTRGDFLAGARQSLQDVASKSGPKASAEIQKIIGKLDEYGLTHAKPKVDADTKPADTKIKKTKKAFDIFAAMSATGRADADTSKADRALRGTTLLAKTLSRQDPMVTVFAATTSAMGALRSIEAFRIHDKSFTVTQHTNATLGEAKIRKADGGQVLGPGTSKSDSILARLSNREFVMPVEAVDQYGLGFMESVRARRLADGGPADPDDESDDDPTDKKKPVKRIHRHAVLPGGFGIDTDGTLKQTLRSLHRELSKLERQVKRSTDAVDAQTEVVDKETQARDQLVDSFATLASDIAGQFQSNLFDPISDVFGSNSVMTDPISVLMGDLANSDQFEALFNGLAGAGVHGDALTAAAQGGIAGLSTFSAYTPDQLAQYQQLFDLREQRGAAVGQQVADAQYGAAVAQQNDKLDAANGYLSSLVAQNDQLLAEQRELKQATNSVEKATKDNGKAVATGKRNRR